MPIQVATALGAGSTSEAGGHIISALEAKLGDAMPALIMVYASTAQSLDTLAANLQEAFPDACVIGASTAGEFIETGDGKSSVSVVAIAGELEADAVLCRDVASNPDLAIASAVEALPETGSYAHRTGILLLDPLAGVSEEVTLAAGVAFGLETPLVGGAAGDDLGMNETFVTAGGEVASNAAVVAQIFSYKPLTIGVSHGHEAISEPIEVTRAEGNVVYELDGRPAWDVWAERTRGSAAKRDVNPDEVTSEELGSFLLRYEAGLKSGGGLKVRAPLGRGEDGSLSFACGIAEGAKIVITESEPERQVESAREAARAAKEQISGPVAGAVVFDCICRNLILGERFGDAVRGMSEVLGGVPLAGFETYGEIALEGGSMSGFHNTTTVVLAFPE